MFNWIKNYIDKKVDAKVQKVLEDQDIQKHAERASEKKMHEIVEIILRGDPELAHSRFRQPSRHDRAAEALVNDFRGLVRKALKYELKKLDHRQDKTLKLEKELKNNVHSYVFSDRFIKKLVKYINQYQISPGRPSDEG